MVIAIDLTYLINDDDLIELIIFDYIKLDLAFSHKFLNSQYLPEDLVSNLQYRYDY